MKRLLAGLLLLTSCRAVHGLPTLDSIDPLRTWFDAHADRARFIALLSPT